MTVQCRATANIYGMPMRGCASATLHIAPDDQACGWNEDSRASCLHHEPQWDDVEETMANMDNLIEATAAGGRDAVYWGRISTLDEVTGIKTWARRKYTVVSVNAATREATVRVKDTEQIVTIPESKFKQLFKKPPRLPDEA